MARPRRAASSRCRPVRAFSGASRFIPTSITVAPSPIQSPGTNSGRPMAATTMSARRVTSGRSLVRLCAMVTVRCRPAGAAPSACRRCSSGRSPRRSHPAQRAVVVAQHHQAAERRAGHHDFCPSREGRRSRCETRRRPWGSIALMTRSSSRWPGSGSCTRMPCTSASPLSLSISASRSALGGVGIQLVLEALHADLEGHACLSSARRPGSRGLRPPARRRGPG